MRTTRACAAAMLLLAGCAAPPNAKEPAMTDVELEEDDDETFESARDVWLAAVRAVRPDEWIPFTDYSSLPARVYFESRRWNGLIFRKGMGPLREGDVAQAYHVARDGTYDFVKSEYEPRPGLRLVVIESGMFVHLFCPGAPFESSAGPEPLRQAEMMATTLLNVPETLHFDWTGPDAARIFSNAAHLNLTQMRQFSARIDGVARPGGIALLCCKRHPEFEQFIDPAEWFDAEFRDAHK